MISPCVEGTRTDLHDTVQHDLCGRKISADGVVIRTRTGTTTDCPAGSHLVSVQI